MEIFQPFGITDRFLANGRIMQAVNLWKADKHIYKNDFTKAKSPYPFMLIQPQKEAEEILLDEVLKRGIEVEYQSELVSWKENDSGYNLLLTNSESIPKVDYNNWCRWWQQYCKRTTWNWLQRV